MSGHQEIGVLQSSNDYKTIVQKGVPNHAWFDPRIKNACPFSVIKKNLFNQKFPVNWLYIVNYIFENYLFIADLAYMCGDYVDHCFYGYVRNHQIPIEIGLIMGIDNSMYVKSYEILPIGITKIIKRFEKLKASLIKLVYQHSDEFETIVFIEYSSYNVKYLLNKHHKLQIDQERIDRHKSVSAMIERMKQENGVAVEKFTDEHVPQYDPKHVVDVYFPTEMKFTLYCSDFKNTRLYKNLI
jgi:hypothetical protein